jgi:hypothetical protein
MPRAEMSLSDRIANATDDFLELAAIVGVLCDVADALVALDGRVVHRDLKPANVLLLEGRWCLADFGISRYAEATTAADTQKYALSPPYAAPERWRSERATSAADVYALGVIAYEMVAGVLPFRGPATADFRDQHLHRDPPPLAEVPTAFAALLDECLFKAPEARPRPANLRLRLGRAATAAASAGLARLTAAHRAEVLRRGESARHASEAQSEGQRRQSLANAATRSFALISSALLDAITSAAPAATVNKRSPPGWTVDLGSATLTLTAPSALAKTAWEPVFDVVSTAELNLRIPRDRYDYDGRSHSLWFGDIQAAGEFGWFETAFMWSPLLAQRGRQDPFALDPGKQAGEAIGPGMGSLQAAWPFTPLVVGELDEFIDRWANWLGEAADGSLSHPSSMPERPAHGSWRLR